MCGKHVGQVAPSPIIVKGKTYYKVKRILDSRLYKGKLQYLVQWKGHSLSEATWVKSRDGKMYHLVKKFHDKYPQKLKEPPVGREKGWLMET